jgi:hypothetical protein
MLIRGVGGSRCNASDRWFRTPAVRLSSGTGVEALGSGHHQRSVHSNRALSPGLPGGARRRRRRRRPGSFRGATPPTPSMIGPTERIAIAPLVQPIDIIGSGQADQPSGSIEGDGHPVTNLPGRSTVSAARRALVEWPSTITAHPSGRYRQPWSPRTPPYMPRPPLVSGNGRRRTQVGASH